MRKIFAVIAFSFASISGCSSTLKVSALDTKNPSAQSAIKYALPLTQFEITVVRRVTECKGANIGGGVPGDLTIANEVSVERKLTNDPKGYFLVDPRSHSTYFNQAGFAIEFHSGTKFIKTVNASSTDQLGPTLVTVIKAVAGLGAIASGAGAGPNAPPPPPLKCTLSTAQKVKDASDQLNVVRAKTNELKQKTLEVKQLKERQAKLLPSKDPILDANLVRALGVQDALITTLKAEAAKLEVLSKDITHKKKLVWPTHGDEFLRVDQNDDEVPIKLPPAVLQTWSNVAAVTPGIERRLNIYVRLVPAQGAYSRTVAQPIQTAEDTRSKTMGIYYREPAPGRLILETRPQVGGAAEEIFNKPFEISQLGFVDSLPVTAEPFESIEFSAEFSKDGRLLKAGYKDTAAAISSITPVLDTLAGLESARKAKELAEKQARQASLEADVKILDAQAAADPTNRARAAELAAAQRELLLTTTQNAIQAAEDTAASTSAN